VIVHLVGKSSRRRDLAEFPGMFWNISLVYKFVIHCIYLLVCNGIRLIPSQTNLRLRFHNTSNDSNDDDSDDEEEEAEIWSQSTMPDWTHQLYAWWYNRQSVFESEKLIGWRELASANSNLGLWKERETSLEKNQTEIALEVEVDTKGGKDSSHYEV